MSGGASAGKPEKVRPAFGPRGAVAVLLVVVALAGVARTLAAFATLIAGYLAVHYDWRLELGMVTGQVVFQWTLLFREPREDKLSYGLILMAVSSLGAALLWPLLLLAHFAHAPSPLVAVAYFFAVVAVMFAVHWVLVARAALPTWLCATWVLYRLFLLAVLVRWR